MEFRSLVAALPGKKSAIYTFERGKTVRHPYAALHNDVVRARENLRAWGVTAGTRVGLYAPNSYPWLVHDLALIELGAISVPFTDDFAGQIDQGLLDKYNIALLLIAKKDARLFPQKPAHVAFLDADNADIRVLERAPSGDPDEADQHSLVFSSGSAGGLKGLVISRKGGSTLPPVLKPLAWPETLQLSCPCRISSSATCVTGRCGMISTSSSPIIPSCLPPCRRSIPPC